MSSELSSEHCMYIFADHICMCVCRQASRLCGGGGAGHLHGAVDRVPLLDAPENLRTKNVRWEPRQPGHTLFTYWGSYRKISALFTGCAVVPGFSSNRRKSLTAPTPGGGGGAGHLHGAVERVPLLDAPENLRTKNVRWEPRQPGHTLFTYWGSYRKISALFTGCAVVPGFSSNRRKSLTAPRGGGCQ